MAISSSKSVNAYSTNSPNQYPYTFTTSFTENSTDVASNTSSISCKATMYGKNINFSDYNVKLSLYWFDNNTNKNGKLIKEQTYTSTAKGTTYEISGNVSPTHLNDGKLQGYTKLVVDGGSGWQPPDTTLQTNNTTLTTIPRATTCPSQTCYVERVNVVNLNPASTSFTHKAKFAIGSRNFEITGTNSLSVDLTDTTIYDLFSEKNISVPVTLETYSGSSKIGTSSGTFVIQCDENLCKPTITATYQDTNIKTKNVTGNNQKIVKNNSILVMAITATAKHSTIDYVTIDDAESSSNTSYTDNKPIKNQYKLVAYDKRGFKSQEYTLNIDLIEYIDLTCSATFYRVSPTTGEVAVDYKGNYFNANIGNTANTLSVSYQYKESGTDTWSTAVALTPTKSGNTYSQVKSLGTGFNYKKQYDFKLNVSDKIINLSPQKVVPKGEPMYWANDEYIKFVNKPLFSNGNEMLNYSVVETWE